MQVPPASALTLGAASCTMNCVGRLAQRLERSVYTRKVVRSNRTVPTIRAQHRITLSGDVVQLVRTLPCHGRGREFESRRPRHSFEAFAESLAFRRRNKKER